MDFFLLTLKILVVNCRYKEKKDRKKIMLTFNDYVLLVGYVSVAAFASYATHEVAGAIRTYLDMNDD